MKKTQAVKNHNEFWKKYPGKQIKKFRDLKKGECPPTGDDFKNCDSNCICCWNGYLRGGNSENRSKPCGYKQERKYSRRIK